MLIHLEYHKVCEKSIEILLHLSNRFAPSLWQSIKNIKFCCTYAMLYKLPSPLAFILEKVCFVIFCHCSSHQRIDWCGTLFSCRPWWLGVVCIHCLLWLRVKLLVVFLQGLRSLKVTLKPFLQCPVLLANFQMAATGAGRELVVWGAVFTYQKDSHPPTPIILSDSTAHQTMDLKKKELRTLEGTSPFGFSQSQIPHSASLRCQFPKVKK